MINDLPEEILVMIMNFSCQRPNDYMNFKLINQRSSFIVGNLEHLFINDGNQYEEDLDELCRRDTSLKTFDWYFKNDITFTLKNVKRLIINNRIDILQNGLKYHPFLELLFNRFYMNVDTQNDIFSIGESLNPLMVAAENNHIAIVRLLIERNGISNPYTRLIPQLFEISIKYNHKNLLNYLLSNHLNRIEEKLSEKLLSIIYRIENCEDILFNLVLNIKVKIESKHLQALVAKHYNQLFKYIYYHHMGWINSSITFKMNLLSGCFSSNNIDGFTILFEEIKDIIPRKEFVKLLFGNRNDNFYNGKKDIIYHIVNNYLNYIDKDSKLLSTCIMNDIGENTMIQLVEDKYHFTEENMKVVLENHQFKLLEKMCQLRSD